MRLIVASVVALGLAVGVWLLWPRTPEVTVASTEASGTTTTLETVPTTTSTTPSTTSATGESTLVTTVEEAEEILQDLWFGWFEGIYNQDEDRIRAVVATEHQVRLATEQFAEMLFDRRPLASDLSYEGTQILMATNTCTVIWTTSKIEGFNSGNSSDVHVLRWNDGWKFFSLWSLRGDLWEGDCEADLRS